MGSKPINNKPNDATPLASNTTQSVMIDKQLMFIWTKVQFRLGKRSNPLNITNAAVRFGKEKNME